MTSNNTDQKFVIHSRKGSGYWNGARWVSEDQAKEFSSTDAARLEMTEAQIVWNYTVLPKKK